MILASSVAHHYPFCSLPIPQVLCQLALVHIQPSFPGRFSLRPWSIFMKNQHAFPRVLCHHMGMATTAPIYSVYGKDRTMRNGVGGKLGRLGTENKGFIESRVFKNSIHIINNQSHFDTDHAAEILTLDEKILFPEGGTAPLFFPS